MYLSTAVYLDYDEVAEFTHIYLMGSPEGWKVMVPGMTSKLVSDSQHRKFIKGLLDEVQYSCGIPDDYEYEIYYDFNMDPSYMDDSYNLDNEGKYNPDYIVENINDLDFQSIYDHMLPEYIEGASGLGIYPGISIIYKYEL